MKKKKKHFEQVFVFSDTGNPHLDRNQGQGIELLRI